MFARLLPPVLALGLLLSGCASPEFDIANLSSTQVPAARDGSRLNPDQAPLVAGWLAHDAGTEPVGERISSAATESYRLDSGDKLRIFVYAQPSLSRIYSIDGEGLISVPLIGAVRARGETTTTLENAIAHRLASEFVRDPHVTVDIQQYRPFFILGEVKAAGQYPYVAGLTVDAAVAIAGGFSDRANERNIQINRRITEGVERLDVSGDAEVRPGDTIRVKERWF
jgi:polysaccharide biosynthesis/export protein